MSRAKNAAKPSVVPVPPLRDSAPRPVPVPELRPKSEFAHRARNGLKGITMEQAAVATLPRPEPRRSNSGAMDTDTDTADVAAIDLWSSRNAPSAESNYGKVKREGTNRWTKASTNPTRYWIGTYFASDEENKEYLDSGMVPDLRMDYQREDVTCWRGQWEYGGKGDKDGKLHAQFAVAFRDQCRAPQARRILGGSWGTFDGFLEPAYSTAVWDYVTKRDTRVRELPGYGALSDDSGHRSDLDIVYAEIAQGAPLWDIMSRFPRQFMRNHAAISKLCAMYDRPRPYGDCEVEIWWGVTGSGKSHRAFHQFPNAYRKSIPGKWWEGYKGEQTVVFEEFNPSEDRELRLPELLKILDKYPYQVEIKGASLQLRANKFIFTTNIDPRKWYEGHPQQTALARRVGKVIVFPMTYGEAQRAGKTVEETLIEFDGMVGWDQTLVI